MSSLSPLNLPKPVHFYEAAQNPFHILHASARTVVHGSRAGLNFTSIHGRAALKQHTLHEEQGTVTFWVLPLQDYFPATLMDAHAKSNPFYNQFVFLSDRESVQEIEAANFCVFFHTYWHPVFMAKFGPGSIGQALWWGDKRTAFAAAGHFQMHALTWYQLAVTWNHQTGIYVLYANGIKVGHSDAGLEKPLPYAKPAPWLYFGNPAYALGDAACYADALSPEQMRGLFREEAAESVNPAVQTELETMYEGRHLPAFEFTPSAAEGWQSGLELSLQDPADYDHFFHQGCGPCLKFTPEGLRITTPGFDIWEKGQSHTATAGELDMTRMYLWTRRFFEGDLYVSVDFKIHRHGGLALLMAQAAGMQGERFLDDYRLRSTGSMRVVCWEDVRNYHWEFYREIVDVRNDLVSHACLKNPWARPINFQIENRTWELERWYRLVFLQEGARLRGTIDSTTVMDAHDHGFENSGPVLRGGYVALRLMMCSDMTFRNLQIHTRPEFVTRSMPALAR